MPVEIRELLIRALVAPQRGGRQAPGAEQGRQAREEIQQETLDQMKRLLDQRRER